MRHFYIRRLIAQQSKAGPVLVDMHRIGVIAVELVKHPHGTDPLVRVAAALCGPTDKFNADKGRELACGNLNTIAGGRHSVQLELANARKMTFPQLMHQLKYAHPQAIEQLSAVPSRQHTEIFHRIIDDLLDDEASDELVAKNAASLAKGGKRISRPRERRTKRSPLPSTKLPKKSKARMK